MTRRNGATLLEALIAIALLAAVAAALAPALYGTAKTSARAQDWARKAEDSRVAHDLLSEAFRALIVYSEASEPRALAGDARTMTLTILPSADGAPKTVTLQVRKEVLSYAEQEDLTLPRPRLPHKADADLPIPGLSGFAYFGAEDREAAPSWTTRWSAPKPPLLVRLERKGAPPVDFEIGARGPLDCAFDPVSRTCR